MISLLPRSVKRRRVDHVSDTNTDEINEPSNNDNFTKLKITNPPEKEEDKEILLRDLAIQLMRVLSEQECPSDQLHSRFIHLSVLVPFLNKSQAEIRSCTVYTPYKISKESAYVVMRPCEYDPASISSRTIYVENVGSIWKCYEFPGSPIYVNYVSPWAFITFQSTEDAEKILKLYPWDNENRDWNYGKHIRSMSLQRWKDLENEYLEIQRKQSHQFNVIDIKHVDQRWQWRSRLRSTNCVTSYIPGLIVYISNLPLTTTKKEIMSHFKQVAQIKYVDYIKGLNFAHLRCETPNDAEKIITKVDFLIFKNQKLDAKIIMGQRELIYWNSIAKRRPNAQVFKEQEQMTKDMIKTTKFE